MIKKSNTLCIKVSIFQWIKENWKEKAIYIICKKMRIFSIQMNVFRVIIFKVSIIIIIISVI